MGSKQSKPEQPGIASVVPHNQPQGNGVCPTCSRSLASSLSYSALQPAALPSEYDEVDEVDEGIERIVGVSVKGTPMLPRSQSRLSPEQSMLAPKIRELLIELQLEIADEEAKSASSTMSECYAKVFSRLLEKCDNIEYNKREIRGDDQISITGHVSDAIDNNGVNMSSKVDDSMDVNTSNTNNNNDSNENNNNDSNDNNNDNNNYYNNSNNNSEKSLENNHRNVRHEDSLNSPNSSGGPGVSHSPFDKNDLRHGEHILKIRY